jgi:superoxide dismutase, Fe-Mn family
MDMAHKLPELPYAMNALEPVISKETLEYHYGKHHQKYVDVTNSLIDGTADANLGIEELIVKAHKDPNGQKLFNNAAQVWNHTFYWNCMSPNGGGEPTGKIADAINKSFGSFADFKEKWSADAAALFGSGWTWLVKKDDGGVAIENLPNAGTPLAEGKTPLLTIDVWEHAYYIDYRNARPKYIEEFWKLVNWDFVNEKLG